MPSLKEQRAETIARARGIAEKAKNDEREMTKEETGRFDGLLAKAEGLETQIKSEEASQARFRAIDQLGPVGPEGIVGKGFLKMDPEALAERLLKTDYGVHNVKSLVAEGTSVAEVEMIDQSPLSQGRPAGNIFEMFPARIVARQFSYLRQVSRVNNAAAVAEGQLKPTSQYQLERVEDHLRVLAHLSEPIDKFWLADNATLTQFLASEMGYGLALAFENQILNGSGTGENLRGLANTSGVQVQAYRTDPILTARAAITAIETVGLPARVFLLSAQDWERIETQQLTTGSYVLGDADHPNTAAPINRATRTLWGCPVLPSVSVPAGTGYLVAEGAIEVMTDGRPLALELGFQGDQFARNQIQARLEGRFGMSVLRPMGVVKMALTGA